MDQSLFDEMDSLSGAPSGAIEDYSKSSIENIPTGELGKQPLQMEPRGMFGLKGPKWFQELATGLQRPYTAREAGMPRLEKSLKALSVAAPVFGQGAALASGAFAPALAPVLGPILGATGALVGGTAAGLAEPKRGFGPSPLGLGVQTTTADILAKLPAYFPGMKDVILKQAKAPVPRVALPKQVIKEAAAAGPGKVNVSPETWKEYDDLRSFLGKTIWGSGAKVPESAGGPTYTEMSGALKRGTGETFPRPTFPKQVPFVGGRPWTPPLVTEPLKSTYAGTQALHKYILPTIGTAAKGALLGAGGLSMYPLLKGFMQK